MKCRPLDRKIESLVSIHQRNLCLRRQNPVVSRLEGNLRTANKRIASRVGSVIMRKGISAGECDRRSRGKAFVDVRQAHIHDAWGQSKVPQTIASKKPAKSATPQRPNSLRTHRSIRPTEVALREIAEAVAYRQFSSLPEDLLVDIHLLQGLEAAPRHRVVSDATGVIQCQVIVA